MSTIEIILGAAAFLAIAYLGIVVYLRNPKGWTNRFFALLALILSCYVIVNPISLHPLTANPENQLFWIRVIMFLASFIGPLLFLLVHTFPHNQILLKRKVFFLIIALMFLTAFLSIGPFVFQSISYPNGNPLPNPGIGMPIFLFDFVGFILLSFIILTKKYLRAAGEQKPRLLYFLIGIWLTFSLMAISTVISIVIFKTSTIIFLGPIYPVILVALTAYAIIKHRFLDIRPLIARAVSFIIFITVLAFLYALLLLSGVERIFQLIIPARLFFIFLALTVVAILTATPLEQWLRKLTNKIFYKEGYETANVLSLLTQIMSETIDLDLMTNKILVVITEKIRLTKAAFLIVNSHTVSEFKSVGYKDSGSSFKAIESLFHEKSKRQCFILEELEEGPTKELFRKLDIAFAIPIWVENNEIAILISGPKLTGEIYYDKDIAILETFASQAGIAIQNAKSYEEVKKLSEELEKRVEERTKQLEAANEKLKELDHMKDEFLSMASHQVKSPIAAIKGYAELVENGTYGNIPDAVKATMQKMRTSSNRLINLIDSLLDLRRIEEGKMKFNFEDIDLVQLLKELDEEFQPLAIEKHLDFSFKTDLSSAIIKADGQKLRQVFQNFIDNAIKYTEQGFVKIILTEDSNGFEVHVNDSGMGINPDLLPKLFQEFVTTKGSGFGLYVARKIVEAHEGKIWAESAGENKGSAFCVKLKR